MSAKVFDDCFSVRRTCGRLVERKEGWTEGSVITPHGIVTLYAQGDDSNFFYSRLEFVWKGVLFARNYHGVRLRGKSAARKAREFADTVVANATHARNL